MIPPVAPGLVCPACERQIPNRPEIDRTRCGFCGASLIPRRSWRWQVSQTLGALAGLSVLVLVLFLSDVLEGPAAVVAWFAALLFGLWVKMRTIDGG